MRAAAGSLGIGSDNLKVLCRLTPRSPDGDARPLRRWPRESWPNGTACAFFQDTRLRVLHDPLFVVTDGAPCSVQAVQEFFPRSAHQRARIM